MRIFDRLRDRKLGQWALAYLAGAWLLLQLVDVLGARWGISDSMARVVDVSLVSGFVIAMVLAWYHGEQGRQRVSGAELLILAGVLGVGAIGLGILGQFDSQTDMPQVPTETHDVDAAAPGIAVLPLRTLSSHEEDVYFSDGLHAFLVGSLERSTTGALKVIASQAALAFRESTLTLEEIGRSLGVTYLVTGTVQRAGDRVRLSVEMADAGSGSQLWNATYDRVLTSEAVFEIQEQVVAGIVGELQVTLRDEEVRTAGTNTTDPRALDLLLRAYGRACEPAIPLLEEAVALDPEYMVAHALLADCHSRRFRQIDRTPRQREIARAHAEKAMELAPNDPQARLAMGWFLYYTGRWDDALGWLDDVPPSMRGQFTYLEMRSYVARRLGQFEESLALGRRVLELSPGRGYGGQVGLTLLYLRRYAEAIPILDDSGNRPDYLALARWMAHGEIEELRQGESLESGFLRWDTDMYQGRWEAALVSLPESDRLYRGMLWHPRPLLHAWALEASDRSSDAQDAFEAAANMAHERLQRVPDDARAVSALALAYAGLGREDEARIQARRAVEMVPPESDALEGPSNLFHLASVHAQLGDVEAALGALRELLRIPSLYPPARLELEYLLRPLYDNRDFRELMDEHRDIVF